MFLAGISDEVADAGVYLISLDGGFNFDLYLSADSLKQEENKH
jgi:hypothetical protein